MMELSPEGETVEHQATATVHTMDVNCPCKPDRERFVVTGQDGEGQDQGYWEKYSWDDETWRPIDGEEGA